MPFERRRHPVFRKVVAVTSRIGVVVLILIGFVAIPSLITFHPRFCATCHPQSYKIWLASTHKHVSCSDCHIKSDIESVLLSRLGLGKKVLMKLNPEVDVAKPASFLGHPPNEMCDRCHKQRRTISTSGDLKIPHLSHTKLRKLHCVDCHRSLVHKSSSVKRNRQSMISCYRCHDGKKAPNSCSACHTEKALPDDHRSPNWLKVHSQIQQTKPDYCFDCHGWVKDYCAECHQRKPRSHFTEWPGWRAKHQALILSEESQGCKQCHGDICVSCHSRP